MGINVVMEGILLRPKTKPICNSPLYFVPLTSVFLPVLIRNPETIVF